MSTDEFLAMFADVLNEPVTSLSLDQNLSDYEDWDSLAVLSLITEVDERYATVLDAEALNGCETVQQVYDLLHKLTAQSDRQDAA